MYPVIDDVKLSNAFEQLINIEKPLRIEAKEVDINNEKWIRGMGSKFEQIIMSLKFGTNKKIPVAISRIDRNLHSSIVNSVVFSWYI